MKNLALKRIQNMKSYCPPLSGRSTFEGMLLDFNERTLSPSSNVQKYIQQFLKSDKLQMYPEYENLEKKLALYTGVEKNQIIITNGSDQAIDIIFRTFTDIGDNVIIPAPSFAMFSQCAQIIGNKIISPLYDEKNLSFPLNEIIKIIDDTIKLIVICNPNNPTGTLVSIDDIEKIAKKAQNAIILIDEAYFEFSNITAVNLIKKYPNIIVIRTFSKAFGLPAFRIGYIVASEMYISELLKVRGPYDINMIAYISSLAVLDDLENMQKYADQIINEAKPLIEDFFRQNNISFYKSSGNFILYKPIIENEEKILKENGVLVRCQDKVNIENTIRLTIGTVEKMRKFMKIYEEKILKKTKKYAFIDRDGTLIFEPQDTFQIDSLDKLKILDGVIEGLKKLQKKGYRLIMISNQDGLGTSSFPKADFDLPHNEMLKIFKENQIVFDEIFICPHLPSENCQCRKPKLGIIKDFLIENEMDKENSFVIGDRNTDILFAKNLEIKAILMKTNCNFYEALIEGGVILHDDCS